MQPRRAYDRAHGRFRRTDGDRGDGSVENVETGVVTHDEENMNGRIPGGKGGTKKNGGDRDATGQDHASGPHDDEITGKTGRMSPSVAIY